MTDNSSNKTSMNVTASYGEASIQTLVNLQPDKLKRDPLWMERLFTIDGYRRLKSGNWTVSGILLLILGVLSDTAQLATTYFDQAMAANPFFSNLTVWALYAVAAFFFIFIIAIVSRSRFCAPCAGFLPHLAFAALVFGAVLALQKAVLSEETDLKTGERIFEDPEGNLTRTNSIIGYLTGINTKIETIQADVREIRETTADTNVRAQRIEIKLDDQNERYLKIAEKALAGKERENARLEEDLRQLLIAILESNTGLNGAEITKRLPEAYERLQDLRRNRLTFEENDPEIDTLLKHADKALESGPGLSLNKAATALKEADARYVALLEKQVVKLDTARKKRLEVLRRRAKLATAKFDYAEVSEIYDDQVGLLEDIYGRNSHEVVVGLNHLAFSLGNQNLYKAAEPHYRRALEIGKRVLRNDHPDIASSLNNLAGNLSAQGQFRAAELLFRRSLEIRARVLGNDHPDTISSLNNLAGSLQAQGQYKIVEPFYRHALKTRERVLGSDHPDTASSLNNLATNLNAQGQYEAAGSLYRRALEIRERVQGGDHPDTALNLNNLAVNLGAQGQYEAAESFARRSLKIREDVLGADHWDTIQSLNTLAVNLDNQGQHRAAESLYRRTLEFWERVLGSHHSNTASSLNNLATNLNAQGQYEAAGSLYRRALEIRERVLGVDHPDTHVSLNNLAFNLGEQGRHEAAEPFYRRVLEIRERILGGDHPNTITSLSNLAYNLNVQGQYEAAEPLVRRVLSVIRAVQPDHFHIGVLLRVYAGIQLALGDRDGALKSADEAVEILTEKLGEDHARTLDARSMIAKIKQNKNSVE